VQKECASRFNESERDEHTWVLIRL
jgi:hypothetical protein